MSIWDLPIVLHEYGHHIGPQILNDLGQRPFELMCGAAKTAVDRAHLIELFADAFAAYACGPAFACTSALLRFDPAALEASEDLPTHPSHERRVRLILWILKERSEEVGDPKWEWLIEEVRDGWRSSVKAAGREKGAALNGEREGEERLFRKLHAIIAILRNGCYRSWTRALALIDVLGGDDAEGGAATDGATIRDVLNAAWLARLNQPDRFFVIGEQAKQLIRAISNRRP